MNILNIEGTISTPAISVDEVSFVLSGETRPENPKKFYEAVFSSLEQIHSKLTNEAISNYKFLFDFEYISTSSLVMIKKLLMELSKLQKDHPFISVEWRYYEMDEDMQMLGEELAEITGLNMDVLIRS